MFSPQDFQVLGSGFVPCKSQIPSMLSGMYSDFNIIFLINITCLTIFSFSILSHNCVINQTNFGRVYTVGGGGTPI